MTFSRPEPLPSEEEVRSIVARIVDGIAGSPGPVPGTDESDQRPEPAPSHAGGVAPAVDGGERSIAVGADHGGFALKERIAFKLKEAGWDIADCGTDSHEAVDYPDFALAVAQRVASGESRWGIVVDGAGIGSAMAANKVPGVRAAPCHDISSARNARQHNHANVLTLGAGLIGETLAWQIVTEWLATDWAGGRHARRVAKIDALDRQYSSP